MSISPRQSLALVASFLLSGPAARAATGSATITNVPDYKWQWGCFGTAAGVVMGYWDANGFPNIYTGAVNGGVAPVVWSGANTNIWEMWATRKGHMGYTNYGHVDDYWYYYESTNDPFIACNRVEHAADCIGDFIGLSQYKWTNMNGECNGNLDAWVFNYWDTSGAKRVNFAPGLEAGSPARDLQSGLREFAQWRGYNAEVFSQLADVYSRTPAGTGFTFSNLVEEINAGFPVVLFLQNAELSGGVTGPKDNPGIHGMVAYGYSNRTADVYIVPDSSGLTNNGTGYDTPITNGYGGFDGSGSYVDIADSANLSALSAFTISAWVRAMDFSKSGVLLSRYKDDSTREWYVQVRQSAIDVYIYDEDSNGWIGGATSVAMDTNAHLVCVVWSGGAHPSNIAVYVDGSLRGSPANSQGSFALVRDLAISTWVGRAYWSGQIKPFGGLMKSVRTYARAASSNEVRDLFLAGDSAPFDAIDTSGLVLFLPLTNSTYEGNEVLGQYVRCYTSWSSPSELNHLWDSNAWLSGLGLRGVIGFHPQHPLVQTSSVPGILNTTTWWVVRSTGQTVAAQSLAMLDGTNYRFAEWRLAGARLPDPTNEAVNPALGIVMTNARTADALYLAESEDSDGDRMEDWWEHFYFGSTNASPDDDADGDTQDNLSEGIAGTGPRDAQSLFELDQAGVDAAFTLAWPWAAGRAYEINWSDSAGLSNEMAWVSVTNPVYSVTNDWAHWLDTNAPSVSLAARFYRVLVGRQE